MHRRGARVHHQHDIIILLPSFEFGLSNEVELRDGRDKQHKSSTTSLHFQPVKIEIAI